MKRRVKIASEIKNLRIIEKIIDDITTESGIDKSSYGKIMVSTMEAVNNAILHGNKCNINRNVNVFINLEKNDLKIIVEDEGEGFNYNNIPDPTLPENIEKFAGRGVFLMRNLADAVNFNEKGNKVELIFRNIR